MKKKGQNLLLIYYKRKAGIALTEEEELEWERYRKKNPPSVEDKIDGEDVERMLRWKEQMLPAEEFFRRNAMPIAIPFPTQQKQETTGRVRRFSWKLVGVAAAVLFMIVYAFWGNSSYDEKDWNRQQTVTGEQKQIALPDGTKVWLNAVTAIRYPPAFEKGRREVVIEDGEAYFEVAHDTLKPFIVYYKDVQVQVVGTKFNVHARDTIITTSLVEGAVKIMTPKKSQTLKPGQQVVVDKQGRFNLSAIRHNDFIAWKSKYFSFHDTRLSVIMEEIERWYNVEVVYVDPLNDVRFTVDEFPRNEPVKALLDHLEASKLVHFEIKGRKIYVSK